ncbi:MAG: sigma-70 family RNA polymerase sigma factor [Deltaproteobacteria bacterium]|nr:sigma-70 family RNA polymerase sigma factor [Deltaproteobacteria bacterium]
MEDSAPTAEDLLAHSEWLTRLARALVGDGDAGDVVQETYEVALGKGRGREGSLRPWLGGVARNVARMGVRGRVRRERREQAVPVHDEVPSPEQLVARAQVQQQVNRLVLELHEPLRSTLLLRFFEGLSAAEIARAQGIPAATVRSRLKDALDRIRASLDAEHGNNRRAWAGLLGPLATMTPRGAAGVAAGGVIVSTQIKVLIAVIVVVLIVLGTRLAGLWGGGGAHEPAPVANAAPAATKAAASPALPTSARELPTVHEADPKGALRIEGQVIDEHDAPVPQATVVIDANPAIVVVTEADGGFVFTGLLRRDYRIEATKGDRYAGPARLRLSDAPEPVTLRMRKGGTLEVAVTDRASGAPVQGADVELRSWLSSMTWNATTDARGIATLAGIGAGMSPLVVRAKGYAQVARMFETAGNPDTVEHVALSLVGGAPLAGRVVDDKGKGVAGARVVAMNASEPMPVRDPYRDAAVSGADGTFSFPTVEAGTWRLVASAPDFAPTTSTPIALDGEHAHSSVELRLVGGAIVRGIVKDRAGRPVAAADVTVVVHGYLPWRPRRMTFTDASGAFAISGLEPRAVDVVAWHESGASQIVTADLAAKHEQTVALTLDVTGAITGTVVDSSGQPIADAQVSVNPAWSADPAERTAWSVRGVQETTSDQTGAFRFVGLPDRSYRVRAARPSATTAQLELADGIVTKPDAAPIKLVVPADGRAIGKIQLAGGKPAIAFTITLGDTNPVPFLTKDGSFVVRAVAGTHELTVAGPGFITTTKDVTIAEAKDTDLGTLTVNAGRSVSGRVLDENGTPVAHATVAAGALLTGGGAELYIKTESIAAQDTETDADGRFVLEGFPAAPLTIVAGKQGVGRSASIQLPSSPDSATIDLVLAATSSLHGKVTRDGQPLGDTVVIANPIGAMASNFFVSTAADGTFVLDALAPGPYVVYPMLGGGGNGPKDIYLRRTEVSLGTTTNIDIDATPGPVTLAITAKTAGGATPPMLGLIAIQLTINPQSAQELRDGTLIPAGDQIIPMNMRGIRGGATTIEGMRPGPHTLCAALGDPRLVASLEIQCMQLTLTAAPTQTATLIVPAAWASGN